MEIFTLLGTSFTYGVIYICNVCELQWGLLFNQQYSLLHNHTIYLYKIK